MQLEDDFRRHLASVCYGMICIIPCVQICYQELNGLNDSLTRGGEKPDICPEELLQRLWIPAGDLANSRGSLAPFLTIAEVLPKMQQIIECGGVEWILPRIAPHLH